MRPEQRDPYSGAVALACLVCMVVMCVGVALLHATGRQ